MKGTVRIVDQEQINIRRPFFVAEKPTEEVDLLDDHREPALIDRIHHPLQLSE